jgi:hypothetical protein
VTTTDRYAKTYGDKYKDIPEYASATEIAKVIRADIKAARGEGLLPSRWKYSVTRRNGGGSSVIDIEVKSNGEAWVAEDTSKCPLDGRTMQTACIPYAHYSRYCEGAKRLSEEAQAAKDALERISRAYNHNGSDIMTDYFDVRYYAFISFDQ